MTACPRGVDPGGTALRGRRRRGARPRLVVAGLGDSGAADRDPPGAFLRRRRHLHQAGPGERSGAGAPARQARGLGEGVPRRLRALPPSPPGTHRPRHPHAARPRGTPRRRCGSPTAPRGRAVRRPRRRDRCHERVLASTVAPDRGRGRRRGPGRAAPHACPPPPGRGRRRRRRRRQQRRPGRQPAGRTSASTCTSRASGPCPATTAGSGARPVAACSHLGVGLHPGHRAVLPSDPGRAARPGHRPVADGTAARPRRTPCSGRSAGSPPTPGGSRRSSSTRTASSGSTRPPGAGPARASSPSATWPPPTRCAPLPATAATDCSPTTSVPTSTAGRSARTDRRAGDGARSSARSTTACWCSVPSGHAFRFPAWSHDHLLRGVIVRWGIYRGIRGREHAAPVPDRKTVQRLG